jgi:hypothetical protein
VFKKCSNELKEPENVFFFILQFAIPRILGFDEVFAGTPEIREGLPSAPDGMSPPF